MCGWALHHTQYKALLEWDSTTLKLGDVYVRAKHTLSAGSDGSRNVYVVSYGYGATDFRNVTHFKLARKQSAKKFHRLSGHVHPSMYCVFCGPHCAKELALGAPRKRLGHRSAFAAKILQKCVVCFLPRWSFFQVSSSTEPYIIQPRLQVPVPL